MTCENARLLLYRFADGLLLADDEQRVSGHVAECAACRARQGEIIDLDVAAAGIEAERPSPELRTRILSEYRARYPVRQPARPSAHWLGGASRIAASIAFIAVVGIGAFLAGRQAPSAPPENQPAPSPSFAEVFPLRLMENYTVREAGGQIRYGARMKIIE